MRVLLIALMLLLPVAAFAQSENQPDGTITTQEDISQDAAIANRIRAILNELDGYENVTVAVASGIVTLKGSTLDAETAERLNALTSRIEGVVAIENEVTETTDVVLRLNPAMQRLKARALQLAALSPLILIAVAIFAAIVFVGFLVARMKQPWDKLAPNAFIAAIYRQIILLLFILGGLVLALDIVGASRLLSGILGAAGIVGLAIGFAVRDTVENFIASIMLSIRQPFRPNDTVEIEGDTGRVIRLTSRATILLSFDGNHIRIPNSTVFKSRIVNFSRNKDRRFTFALSVASEADLTQARTLADQTLNDLPFVLKTPAVSVWVQSVDDSSVTLNMAAWVDQDETSITLARSEGIRLTKAAFDVAGISAPEPTYRLMHSGAVPQAGISSPSTKQNHLPADPPAQPAQPVEAKVEKELAHIVDKERAEEHADLLRENAEQE